MKTGLRLNADQEKLWGPFEFAVKDGAKARVLALQKEQSDNLSPMDRLNATAERLAQTLRRTLTSELLRACTSAIERPP